MKTKRKVLFPKEGEPISLKDIGSEIFLGFPEFPENMSISAFQVTFKGLLPKAFPYLSLSDISCQRLRNLTLAPTEMTRR